MKKYLIGVALCSLIAVSCQKENVLQQVDDVCTMMDDINFMKYSYEHFDVNHDSKVSMEEANAVKEISVYHQNILSFKGIEYFTNLTSLSCHFQVTDWRTIIVLDVSKNRSLEYLNCSQNKITKLDLSKNSSLTDLNCSSCELTMLNLANNSSLERLDCSNNSLISIDVSKNLKLIHLNCSDNNLTTLDVSKNKNLIYLDCSNNNLTAIDISNNTQLENCYCNPQKNDKVIGKSGFLYGIWALDSKAEVTYDSNNKEIRNEVDYSSCHFFLSLSEPGIAIAKKGSFTELDLNDVDVDAAQFSYNEGKNQISFKKTLWVSDSLIYHMRLFGTYDILELSKDTLVFQQEVSGVKTIYAYHKHK